MKFKPRFSAYWGNVLFVALAYPIAAGCVAFSLYCNSPAGIFWTAVLCAIIVIFATYDIHHQSRPPDIVLTADHLIADKSYPLMDLLTVDRGETIMILRFKADVLYINWLTLPDMCDLEFALLKRKL